MNKLFIGLDAIGRALEPLIPNALRERALRRAEQWTLERLNGEHGLGAIFPAMVNAHEALICLGYGAEDAPRDAAKRALERLVVEHGAFAYCQPCVSPVWDTALASAAMLEAGGDDSRNSALKALDWLATKQLRDEPADWREDHPQLEGGGWAFQFDNAYYPDLDDTAMAAFSMRLSGEKRFRESIRRAAGWIAGMQSRNGGFASFDADNTCYYLNEIPFADHGALLDPPTADVSARCVMLLAALDGEDGALQTCMERCLSYLHREQEPDGPWFGRWGTNFIYGTWSVLMALEQTGESVQTSPAVRKAVAWLKRKQRQDGGWGESNYSYFDPSQKGEYEASTPFQTAWAVLALIAADEGRCEAVQRGVEFLLRTQQTDGLWDCPEFTAPGFPRVFYLRYHGYNAYFPLWALARYRDVLDGR